VTPEPGTVTEEYMGIPALVIFLPFVIAAIVGIMKHPLSEVIVVLALVLCVSAQQQPTSHSSVLHNERLKTLTLKDLPITGNNYTRIASGFWLSESNEPSKAHVFPQQVKIICTHSDKTCRELSVALAAVPVMISVQDIDEDEYAVDSWSAHGLVASYGGGEGYSRCQRRVLTMDFDSGTVSVSDIPTHKKGCEALQDTDSYRLVRGNYYVDTSPGNDMDKPKK
jgi:hypothetical protein